MNAPPPVFAATPHIVVPPPGPLSRAGAASLAALESPAFDARRKAREATSGEDFAAIVYAAGQGDGAGPATALMTDFAALPFPENSLDLVVLPHALEMAHATAAVSLRGLSTCAAVEDYRACLARARKWGLRPSLALQQASL